jgi:chromosome segregation ATPase
MRVPVILLLALVAATMATETEVPLSILSQVTDQPFGNAIGSLIQMHMRSNNKAPSGKLNAVITLLNQLKSTIEAAQEKAEVRYNSKSAWCSDTIAQLEKEYEAAKKAAGNSQADYNELTREQAVKKNDLNASTESKADIRADLEKAQTDLETENTVFARRNADYSEAIAACKEAIRLLLSLGNRQGGSFVQLNQSFGNIKTKLEKHTKNTNSAFIEPILDVLSQLANGAQYDYSKITAIVDLIRSLLQNLESAQLELESNHNKVDADLNTLVANLSSQLETVRVNVDVYGTRLGEIEIRLNELKPLIAEYNLLVTVNGQMLEGTKADCKGNDQLYSESQQSRVKELAIIERLLEYFVSQVAGRN